MFLTGYYRWAALNVSASAAVSAWRTIAFMPILDIELVGGNVAADLARRLATAAGDALGSRPGGTWVKLRVLPADHYAENTAVEVTARPVFVTVIERNGAGGDGFAEKVTRLTRAVADACGRDPDTVHVIYQPAAAGRVAFGGSLVGS